MSKVPNVALLLETSRGYGRQVTMGVSRYSEIHGPWSFLLTPADFEQQVPDLARWGGDGVVARLASPRLERALLEADLPTIVLDMEPAQSEPSNPLSRFSDLSVDSESATQLAVDHLLERKYTAYAFVGMPGNPPIWSAQRQQSFAKLITKAGFKPHLYEPSLHKSELAWETERPKLAEWLQALPKPVGVMACNDVRGRQVLDACQLAEIEVPKKVAVIGVDNDELFCGLAHPSLSSVSLNAVAAGYQAAERLDKMMQGKSRKPARMKVKALRVVPRQSTNSFAIDDATVVEALEFIRDSKGAHITVPEVVGHTRLSRRELDVRFRKQVGHTISVEIQRVRLEHAKALLEETDYPIPNVAEAAGYSSASYMVQVFRAKLGTTPAKYRASVRRFTVENSNSP